MIARIIAVTCAVSLGVAVFSSRAQAADERAERLKIVPRVAHHQHLLGPTALAAVLARREGGLPLITLPADLQTVVQRREEASGQSSPSDIFAEDVVLLELANGNRWVKGRAAAQSMVSRYSRDTHFLPVSYGVDGSVAHVEGVVRTGQSTTDEMNFAFTLRKSAAGAWQIAVENTTSKTPPDYTAPVTADDLIRDMDLTGIRKAVIMSLGYTLGRSPTPTDGEYGRVQDENNWNIEQAKQFPGRLLVFCGVNPLRDYALAEIERCAKLPLVRGIKLHFANSNVDIRKPEHLEKLRAVFRAANAHKLAIMAHVWVRGDYGREQSQIFLDNLLPEAPDVTVQVAHLAGAGPGYGPDEALAVFADAITKSDARTRNLYFDVTTVVTDDTDAETAALIVRRLRQIGLRKILFGSDMILPSNPGPTRQWATFRRVLPLTNAELKVIATNVAPYVR